VERLPKTLLVTRVAVFLASDEPHEIDGRMVASGHFELAASHGLTNLGAADLRALDDALPALRQPRLERPHLPRKSAAGVATSERAAAQRRFAGSELLSALAA